MADPITLPSAPIAAFEDHSNIVDGDLFVVVDSLTGKTKRTNASRILPAQPSTSYKWVSTFDYAVDAIVEYQGYWYLSLQTPNLGKVPTTEPLYWEQQLKASSGFVFWAPGVYTGAEVFVMRPLDHLIQFFTLDTATRPFLSTDFEVEYAQGLWELMSERGYVGIQKTAHGWPMNTTLTFKAGAWNTYTTGDRAIAIVRDVVSVDLVIVVLIGNRLHGFTGLTPGALYFAQADGTISTVETNVGLFIAISATEAILFADVGGQVFVLGAQGVNVDNTDPLNPIVKLGGEVVGFVEVVSYNTANPDLRASLNIDDGAISLLAFNEDLTQGIDLKVGAERILITDTRTVKKGAEYAADYSSAFVARSLVDKDYVDNAVTASASNMAIDGTYATIAALLAGQAGQEVGAWYMVTDATTDPSVASGWAIYQKLGTTTGTLADYFKVAEAESLDVTINNGSETQKGLFEEATDAEMQAATAAGLQARLVVNPSKLATWWTWIKTQAVALTGIFTAKHIAAGWGTLTDAATIAWDANVIGNFATVTLAGNRTLDAIANPLTGGLYVLRVAQDGTGNRTLAFNAQFVFGGTVNPILNPAANDQTVLTWFYDGTSMRFCGASGNYQLANLFLTAQVAAGSDQRPVFIDSTGKLQKSTFVNHSQSLAKLTVTGNTTTNTVLFEVLNSALSSVLKLYNDQIAEFGGATSVLSILTGVISGGAYLEFNDNQAEAWRFSDKTGNNFITFNSTTGALSLTIHRRVKYDHDLGFAKWHIQAFLRTSTTAGAANLLSSVSVPTDNAVSIEVNHLFAYATDGAVVIANGNREALVRNVAGTVSGALPTFTVLGDPATTANWSIVANNTNKRADINFVNTTGTGKTFDVMLDYTYVLQGLPT